MSRFLSESRLMDPTHPRPRACPANIPFHARDNWNPAGDPNLDDHESLMGKPLVARHGTFKRGFRNNGPEISETNISNG